MRAVVLLVVACVPLTAAPVPTRNGRDADPLTLELTLPPLGLGDPAADARLRPESSRRDGDAYADGTCPARLRAVLAEVHTVLWATSPAEVPRGFSAAVRAERDKWKLDPAIPTAFAVARNAREEAAVGEVLLAANKRLARLSARLEAALEKLEGVKAERDEACLRRRAQYDLLGVWLRARIMAVEEQACLLGNVRRDGSLVPEEAERKGWRMTADAKLRDWSARKKASAHVEEAREVARVYKGTRWATLATYAEAAALGVRAEAR